MNSSFRSVQGAFRISNRDRKYSTKRVVLSPVAAGNEHEQAPSCFPLLYPGHETHIYKHSAVKLPRPQLTVITSTTVLTIDTFRRAPAELPLWLKAALVAGLMLLRNVGVRTKAPALASDTTNSTRHTKA